MRTKIIILVLLLAGYAACAPEKARIDEPADLVKQSVMVNVLSDIHMAEARVALDQVKADSLPRLVPGYYNDIFTQREVNEDEFIRTFNWYMGYPDKMEALYEDILLELSRRESQ